MEKKEIPRSNFFDNQVLLYTSLFLKYICETDEDKLNKGEEWVPDLDGF